MRRRRRRRRPVEQSAAGIVDSDAGDRLGPMPQYEHKRENLCSPLGAATLNANAYDRKENEGSEAAGDEARRSSRP